MRRWKRHLSRWQTQRTCPGTLFVARAEEGRIRPYDLGEAVHALEAELRPEAVRLLEWLLAAERVWGADGGLRITHAEAARLLRCSRRHAQDLWHELVNVGLVDQRHWFRARLDDERAGDHPLDGSPRHYEVTARYVTTSRCKALVADLRRNRRGTPARSGSSSGGGAPRGCLDGTKIQPGGSQSSLREDSIGVRPRGAVRGFVGEVRDKRRVAERERAAAARAVERERLTLRVVSLLEGGRMLLSDGRVIDSPGVSSAALAERLRRRRVSGGAVEAHELAILDAWRAFEGRAGGGT